jgi:hypothetical protein
MIFCGQGAQWPQMGKELMKGDSISKTISWLWIIFSTGLSIFLLGISKVSNQRVFAYPQSLLFIYK